MKNLVFIALAFFTLSGCVSSKLHKELQSRYREISEENKQLRNENNELQAQLQVAENRIASLEKQVSAFIVDTTKMTKELRKLRQQYSDLNRSYEFLMDRNEKLLKNNKAENQRLMQRLNQVQKELQVKEDSLQTEQQRLKNLAQALQQREQRVNELQTLINQKDSTVNAVRQRLKDALLNFEGKGLSIEKRNGKVYVSLENRLLFASGSWNVNSEGQKALRQLAVVLAENPDLSVTVEGHTDNQAFGNSKSAVNDNWDLSVMRATAIVKIITENEEVKPAQITAAGRSEYLPVAPNETPEGRAKNRRTEIIITPKLSELTQLLEETD